MIVKVKDFIDYGFDNKDSEILIKSIDLSNLEEEIILDFTGVKYFTTLFLNDLIFRLMNSKFETENLSDYGRELFNRCLDIHVTYRGANYNG